MRKDKLDISDLLSFEKSKVKVWLDKLGFLDIFLVWLIVVVCYGFIYYFFASDIGHLYNTIDSQVSVSFWESLYFSFVTATTTGFGDVIPMGIFKAISVAEVITGLLLLAIVTSKFVSIKQDQIMKELYDISINEKISRLRSSLFLYKQHLNRLSSNAQENTFKNLDLKNLGMYFTNYEDVLVESLTLVTKEGKNANSLVDLDLDLLAKSINSTAQKTIETTQLFDKHNIAWSKNNEVVLAIIGNLNDELYTLFINLAMISPQTKRSLRKYVKKISKYILSAV